MADRAILDRLGPLAGRRSASVAPLAPALRFSLRGAAAAVAPVAAAFGVAPGQEVCRAVVAGDRAALWLGPDEWMLCGPLDDAPARVDAMTQALTGTAHSLVDISHRNTGFTVSGNGAETLLSEGCPLDLSLSATPVGFCSRTVLGKCEVILWRTGPDAFRIECWRSFAPYVEAFLHQAASNI